MRLSKETSHLYSDRLYMENNKLKKQNNHLRKYKAMWEELKHNFDKEYFLIECCLTCELKKIEQKYKVGVQK